MSEIDEFIASNNLIHKQEQEEKMGDAELESDCQNDSELLRNDRKVKQILFKVPEHYIKLSESEEIDQIGNEESTGESSDQDSEVERNRRVGAYSLSERLQRIKKYKEKMSKRRASKPISKVFSGRSKVANQKLRINGKFVKASAL